MFDPSPLTGPSGVLLSFGAGCGAGYGFAVKTAYKAVSAAPAFVSQVAVVSGVGYIATGTSATTDWKQTTP